MLLRKDIRENTILRLRPDAFNRTVGKIKSGMIINVFQTILLRNIVNPYSAKLNCYQHFYNNLLLIMKRYEDANNYPLYFIETGNYHY